MLPILSKGLRAAYNKNITKYKSISKKVKNSIKKFFKKWKKTHLRQQPSPGLTNTSTLVLEPSLNTF